LNEQNKALRSAEAMSLWKQAEGCMECHSDKAACRHCHLVTECVEFPEHCFSLLVGCCCSSVKSVVVTVMANHSNLVHSSLEIIHMLPSQYSCSNLLF